MRLLLVLLFFLAMATFVVAGWLKLEHEPPTATLQLDQQVVGRHARFDLEVSAPGWPGLERIQVLLVAGDKAQPVLQREYPARNWFGSGVNQDRAHVEIDLIELDVPEGTARLQAVVETHAWRLRGERRRTLVDREIQLDLTPPSLTLLSTQHNVRLGGANVAVFRASRDATVAGIQVESYFFPAIRGYFSDPDALVCFFAVPQDLTAKAKAYIRAVDAAGNAREVTLPLSIKHREFPERTMEITDDFLERKVPEILSANRLRRAGTLVEQYVFINSELRRETERRIREITEKSELRPLWQGTFRRQSNAAPMSAFADHRVYVYQGKEIDRQTHLGYDLASVRRAPVEASAAGKVVFAGDLGIYGETVILDHGLGIFTLYGHLSTIAVKVGQEVALAETLGQTGETGLAGGDHLHYSVMLHGIHVDPVEWWDPLWIRDHVEAKLSLLPASFVNVSRDQPAASSNGESRTPVITPSPPERSRTTGHSDLDT